MIRKITLLFLLCIGVMNATYAQSSCGSDLAQQKLFQANPNLAQLQTQYDTQLAQWLRAHNNLQSLLTTASGGDTIWEIPVVVHVMHTGGAVGTVYNISDGRIDSTIDYLNKVFETTWPSYPAAGSGGTKFPFRFVLAKRSPNCTTTNGIVRVNASATFSNYTANGVNLANSAGVDDNDLKALSVWPADRYYNIWVVNRIDGADGLSPGVYTAGYAMLPPAPAAVDGCVMLASQMNINRITLPHEVGHSFALRHTFQGDAGGSICPPIETGANCDLINDFCCDTQPHQRLANIGSCPTGTQTCHSVNYTDATAKNIMNYTNCQDRFTPDQRDRFIGALFTYRSSLISSSGSIPIASVTSTCTPGIVNASSNLNSGPRNVKIVDGGGRIYIDVTSSGYGGDGNVTYRNMTCAHRINLQAGKTYTFSTTSRFGDKAAAFIDFNNDGILGNSAGERLNVVTQTPPNNNSHIATFTVPVTASGCTPIRMRVRADATNGYIDSCSNLLHGQTEDFEVVITGSSSSGSASVTLTNPPGGGNPSCFGTWLTFKANPSSGTTVIGYQWYRNGNPVSGQTADSFMWNGFQDKDSVYVKMFYTSLCGADSVLSDTIGVERRTTIPPAVTIGVTGGTNPTCIDDTVTFSVIGNSNPGGAPTYQWRSNGVDIPGATGPTFKAIGRGGETITVRMNSSAPSPCSDPGFAISNGIAISYTTKVPVANIALTIGTNPGCAGQLLQFQATPTTGGTAPTYQWTVNNSPVTGATASTFNTSTLAANDEVRVIMTSNSACADPKTVTSDSIRVLHTKITADISIAQTTGTNPACEGKPLIFSANTTNAGKNPKFQWIVNGLPITGATTPIYVTDSLRNADRVQCVLIATDSCVLNPLDTSNFITMSIIKAKRPTVSFTITAGKNPGCLDSLVEFTAVAVDLGTNPDYTWIVNGFPTANGAVFSNNNFLDGNTVMVRANQTDGGCYLPDTVYSAPLVMVRSTTPTAPVISLVGNTIVTNFDSSFVWFGPDGEMPDGPDGKAYPSKIGNYYAVTNNRGCWSRPSNILGITLLDISSLDVSGMEVYPNPTSDKVILDWKGQLVNYRIEVRNAIGQSIMTDEANNVSRKEINLGDMPAGNYFILLKDNAGRVGVVKVTLNSKQ